MLNVKVGNPNKPPRVLIYGVEGVGKSTLGAKAPKAIFVSPEGGTDELKDQQGNPVQQFAGITTFQAVVNAIKELTTQKHDYKTVVLDSADWIETLAHQQIIGVSNKTITTVNGGYGAGYRESQIMHKMLIDQLSALREEKGMNVVVTAHAHVKAVKDPSMTEDYDGFEIKCHEFVSSLWREWVDALFFARFRTFIKATDDTVKARALGDGTRIIYTQKQPAFQAKNRYGLPPEMEFTENFWNEFMTLAKKAPAALTAKGEIDQMKMEMNDMWVAITDPVLKEKVMTAVQDAGENPAQLQLIYNRLKEISGKRAS